MRDAWREARFRLCVRGRGEIRRVGGLSLFFASSPRRRAILLPTRQLLLLLQLLLLFLLHGLLLLIAKVERHLAVELFTIEMLLVHRQIASARHEVFRIPPAFVVRLGKDDVHLLKTAPFGLGEETINHRTEGEVENSKDNVGLIADVLERRWCC